MTMVVNHQKLHPIYAALDGHQYNKAVKLCLQQAAHNPMARALLAHAYQKAGQRYQSLVTLQSMLLNADGGGSGSADDNAFTELSLEVLHEQRHQQQHPNQTSAAAAGAVAGAPSSAAATPTSARTGGKGKKGKKKGSGAAATATPASGDKTTTATSSNSIAGASDWDLVDELDATPEVVRRPPADREDWLLPSAPPAPYWADETLLSTCTMTLRHLQLPLSAFQLHSWVSSASAVVAAAAVQQQQPTLEETLLIKAYLSGLNVLVHPKYTHDGNNGSSEPPSIFVFPAVMAQMQVLALTWSRRVQHQHQPLYGAAASAWAAQAALWQVTYSQQLDGYAAKNNDPLLPPPPPTNSNNKLKLLPRLAESLAGKCIAATPLQQDNANYLGQTEFFLLYLQTLKLQNKWEEQLAAIELRLNGGGSGSNSDIPSSDNDTNESNDLVYPPRPTLLDMLAQTSQQLGRYNPARKILEGLLEAYPDNWTYWIRHLECSSELAKSVHEQEGSSSRDNKDDDGLDRTLTFVDHILKKEDEKANSNSGPSYPIRGPLLVRVRVAADRVQRRADDSSATAMGCLVDRIMDFGRVMAARASCTYSDLLPYLDLVLKKEEGEEKREVSSEEVMRLLDFLQGMRVEPSSADPKVRRSELRAFVFCVQMNYRIIREFPSLRQDWMPAWMDMIKVWKSFQDFDCVTDEDQKENRPADELILLAVQQLLRDETVMDSKLLAAASILEAGISYSPYNAYLKISAMFVYSQLHSAGRSWELFQQLFVKHIQHESCSYLILPILRSGGLYQETIAICKEIIRLQRIAVQDAGEFSGRAMENGALSKADEFLNFHWKRINKSLTTLEAKGLILDAAPLFVYDEKQQGTLGTVHGIVGGPADFERAHQIVSDAHDPFAAFSLLRLRGNARALADNLSDNRDFSVLAHDILLQREFESPEEIVRDSLQRGHLHGLLIRAALCVEMTKGPKKGKIVPASDTLKKRCTSMLSAIDTFTEDCGNVQGQPGYSPLLRVVMNECRVLVAISGGLTSGSPSAPTNNDSLEAREEAASSLLGDVCEGLKAARKELSPLDCHSIQRVSRLLPECIVPIFAVFHMCAELLDAYGWGRKKRKTKRCAAALADVSVAFTSLLDDMISCLEECLSGRVIEFSEYHDTLVPALVDEITFEQTTSYVCHYQEVTKDRIANVLLEMKRRLASFDVQD